MSSEIEGAGVVALALPLAAAAGAGWLAWQTGKLLIGAGQAVDRYVAEKQRQIEEAEKQRKMMAINAHNQLVDMCRQVIVQLEKDEAVSGVEDFAQMMDLKLSLEQVCEELVPDDVAQIESLNSLGYMRLESAVSKQRHLASLRISDTERGLYHGLSVADLMDDLRLVFATAVIRETTGSDVRAADPNALERAELNERLAQVTGRIVAGLEYVDELANNYGLSDANKAWFESCFFGVDEQIQKLCCPTTSNQELKKGIKRLEDIMAQYDMMLPAIEEKQAKLSALYAVYAEATKALGEKTYGIKHFKTVDEMQEELKRLEERVERAKECAEIYNTLGESAYMCYAWDVELQKLGYAVRSRDEIVEMANYKPKRAKLGQEKLPFYKWDEEELTQIYSVSDDCALQLIVHKDGSVSMQTMAEDEYDKEIVKTQKQHCDQMKELYQNLRKNWFIVYDYEETGSPEEVMSIASWQMSDDNAWRDTTGGFVTEQRKGETKQQEMHTKQ